METDHQIDVLILTTRYGGGHYQAAKAICYGFKKLQPDIKIEILDYVRWVNATLDYLTRLAYVKVTSKAPRLWHLLYDLTDRPFFVRHNFTNRLGWQKLYNYINYKKPKLIISTHFLTSAVVGQLKMRGLLDIPLATIITDNILHYLWLNPAVDLYLVANEEIRKDLIGLEIEPEKIMVTGIPVDIKFAHSYSCKLLRVKNGLNTSLPTILVMSGAYGMGDITDICRYLAGFEEKIQVLVIAGNDEKLKRKIERIAEPSANPFYVYGFVDNVFELMALSDLLISKAGGLTTTEALASNLPMLLYKPIPGQEVGNANYLRNMGVAEVAYNLKDFIRIFEKLMAQPQILKKMADNCSKVKKPLATIGASKLLLELIK